VTASTSTVDQLDVDRDLWKVGLTPLVHRAADVARAIATIEDEPDAWGGSSAVVAGQHAVVVPVSIPVPSLPQAEFDALQKWEGHVIAVRESEFTATLVDLTQPGVEEEVVLDLSELSEDDLPLVQPGAVFYWSVGYRVEQSGERSRSSVIWFRRLPAWTEKDIEHAAVRANELKAKLGL
jgi:hypothetical protein